MKKEKRVTKKKVLRFVALAMCLVLLGGLFTACGQADSGRSQVNTESKDPSEPLDIGEESRTEESGEVAGDESQTEPVSIRVGSLKGPTTLGILFLMDKAEKGDAENRYEFQMATGADELLPLMVQGDLDIALVPANVASVLYQRTEGAVTVVDINTLGVLYVVSGSSEIGTIADLKGKTIYLTGMGTTPEASLRYVLQENGISESDYTLEFKSEATEVAAVLAENPEAVGLLPQPFVTAALLQNSALQIVLDLNEEWNKVQEEGGSCMVTGATVVRRAFLEEHPEAVAAFLEEHKASVDAINADLDTGAALAVKAEIVAQEPIAKQAIPDCNIVCITGQEMKTALSGYLQVLADFEPSMIGGQVPGDDFYYVQ